MPIIKCKMCGGDLRIEEGSTVCECEYCGTRQTVPSADNEKKLTLFSRAGRLLRACEFDKAAGVFETIVADFPEEAEAYWGLVLCKYGIEYVDDPATGKKIPTCHRSSFESVLDDPNFEQACENTDALARRVYRDEARQIEDLRKRIIEVSGKEEPYDVFISYKETDGNGDRTLDSVIAQDIYTELTENGYRVFFSRISLEDKLGTEYEPYIFAALNSAKVMLVVGTDYENFNSVWVKNEWSRFLKLIASGQKKTLIPVFKNMDAYDMPKEFAKLAAQDMGKVGAMQDLVRGVEKLVRKKENTVKETVKETVVVQGEGDMKTIAAVKRGRLAMEDGEFERAKEFFEQALTLDAECAEAYWGIALADEKCPDEKTYISRACGQNVSAERISLPPDNVRIAKCVDSCAVEGYLSPEKLQDLFRFDRNYTTYVKARVLNAQQQKENFQKNRNFSRAFRFATGETLERMNAFQNQLFGELDQNVSLSREHAETARQKKADAYLKHLAVAEEKAEILHSEAEKKREDDYLIACKMQESAETIDQYQTVIRRYTDIGDYQDCKERIEQCRAAAKVIENQERLRKEEAERKTALEKAEAEREQKKVDYQRLVKRFEGITERDELAALEKQFLAFGEYEDAQVMAQQCERMIADIDEEIAEQEAILAKSCHLSSSSFKRIVTGGFFIVYMVSARCIPVNMAQGIYKPFFMTYPVWYTYTINVIWLILWFIFSLAIIKQNIPLAKMAMILTGVTTFIAPANALIYQSDFSGWYNAVKTFTAFSAWEVRNIMLIVEAVIIHSAFSKENKTARKYSFITAGIVFLSAAYVIIANAIDYSISATDTVPILSSVLLTSAYIALGSCFD